MTVTVFLLAIAAIFLIGAVGEVIFQRTQIPDVVWLILAGILLGDSVTGMVTRPQLGEIAPYFAALTLVVVLFDGGTALKLSDLSRSASRSSLLAVCTWVAAVIALTCVSMLAASVGILPRDWTWSHGLLVGAILGGSSSIIIMPAMALARVEPKIANLVSLESALTDAFCVVGAAAMIDIMLSGATGAVGPMVTLLQSFGFGVFIGLGAGAIWILFLRVLHSGEHSYPVTLSILLILYVVIDRIGGSAAMGILTFAVVLGNADAISARLGMAEKVQLDMGLRGFHRQMTFIIKSFFFVFIGAMLGPPFHLIAIGVFFGLVLFGARIPAVKLATAGAGELGPNDKKMVMVAMPRGMAAGVLATMPVAAGVPGTEPLPVIVFAAVLTSILIFAVGFPMLRRQSPASAASSTSLRAATGGALAGDSYHRLRPPTSAEESRPGMRMPTAAARAASEATPTPRPDVEATPGSPPAAQAQALPARPVAAPLLDPAPAPAAADEADEADEADDERAP